jgi:uncharacterized membrane protein
MNGNMLNMTNFSFGCHGIPERCFKIKGRPMAFCARCLGVSIGHILAIINFIFFRLIPPLFIPFGLVIIYSDWLIQNKFKLYHSNISRLITGTIGGYSVGLIIWWTIKFLFDK